MADRLQGVTRRELLKLSPLLGLGAFLVPSWRDRLLEAGVSWSDEASGLLFRRDHSVLSRPAAEVVPLDQFPYNYYDVLEPDVDFDTWALKVGGAVARPGAYTLDQIRALPKVTQNTRHVCVEGWDVVGRFGGARLGDFLAMVGADPSARFLTVTCADVTTNRSTSRPRVIRSRCCATRCTTVPSLGGTARRFGSASPPRSATNTRSTS